MRVDSPPNTHHPITKTVTYHPLVSAAAPSQANARTIHYHHRYATDSQARIAFDEMDTDGDGLLIQAEIEAYLAAAGYAS